MNNFYHQLKLIIKILKYTHHIKNSYGIFKIASNNHKYASQFSYENLKNDKDVVLAAVNQDGKALKYVSEILQDDKDVVLAAVIRYGYALYCASEELQNDLFLLNLLHNFFNLPKNNIKDKKNEQWLEERMKIRDILIEQKLMQESIINHHQSVKSKFLKF